MSAAIEATSGVGRKVERHGRRNVAGGFIENRGLMEASKNDEGGF